MRREVRQAASSMIPDAATQVADVASEEPQDGRGSFFQLPRSLGCNGEKGLNGNS